MSLSREAVEEFPDFQIVGSDAVERRECATEHMVQSAEFIGSFEGKDIARLFNDAERSPVPFRAGADRAGIRFGDVAADGTGGNAVFDVDECAGHFHDLFPRTFQHEESKAKRRLATDAGQPGEFLNKLLQCF